jgi:CheY-like chemotaxis protein
MKLNATILIVEDNDDDYEACVLALKEDNNLANPIVRAETGDEALDYIYARGEFADGKRELPCIILLDLNLPGTDGREVLAKIKNDPEMRLIPVIIMTSSRDEFDIEACYSAGANSYVAKPIDLDGFIQSIARLKEYWFQISLLPAQNRD